MWTNPTGREKICPVHASERFMALSDSCFDFLEAVRAAARTLSDEIHRYSAPEYPVRYGDEIDALRRACAGVADAPYDPEAGARLIRLAASVMLYHDTPPGVPVEAERRDEMKALIHLLEADLDHEEAEAVPSIVQNIVQESRVTEAAAARLKLMLPRLGKVTYEAAIKILTDIASATAKKMLGL
ncbi:MAG TPA: DUF2321 domain-containing protein [Stellaceae bacterium]